MVTNDRVAFLQSGLYEANERIAELEKAIKEAVNIIYSVGGPLNDNIDQFSPKQQRWFSRIVKELGY